LEQADILGANVDCLDFQGILNLVLKWSNESIKRNIMYVNAHSLNLAYIDPEFLKIINNADIVYPDGISSVWASRILGGPRLHKLTGADWISGFCDFALKVNLSIYILAGKPGVANLARHNLLEEYPELDIVGVADGYFHEMSELEIVKDIMKTKPQLLFVGMGTPLQEKWIYSNRKSIDTPICWSVGALFDYVAGVEKRVPGWMNKLGLEWFWRLLMDPVGKWKRYLIGNPLFVYRILQYKLSN
jgi:N-acetylglucosaminyldiphosphoundecaprenol N-acetyl-beta-D-mannosaminyltransferase